MAVIVACRCKLIACVQKNHLVPAGWYELLQGTRHRKATSQPKGHAFLLLFAARDANSFNTAHTTPHRSAGQIAIKTCLHGERRYSITAGGR